MEKTVRLRFTGLVMFATKVFGEFTGLAFTILVIRILSPVNLGIWQWISTIIAYTLIPISIINFWIGRFVARDYSYSRTGLVLSLVLFLPVTVFYIILIPVLATAVQSTTFPFLIAAAFIPLYFVVTSLNSVSSGTQPQYMGYAEASFELVKVAAGFFLVFILSLSLVGAIFSVEVALLVQVLVLLLLTRRYLRGTFKADAAKQWISHSWLSGYMTQSSILSNLDAVIIVAVSGLLNTLVLAYYTVASSISATVGLAAALATGLAPRLLKGGKATSVELVLRLTFLFGIPMLIGSFVLVQPMLSLFGSKYTPLVSSLMLLARILIVAAFIDLFSNIADVTLMGTVDVDKGKPGFKELAKSNLSLVPTVNFGMGASYLLILYVLLRLLMPTAATADQIAILWGIAYLAVRIPFVLFKFLWSKRVVKFGIPYKAIAKYLVASVVMALVVTYCLRFVVYGLSIYEFWIYPVALVGVGAAVYGVLMVVIDKEFRQLLKAIVRRSR
jgi:O-antigen/teichoic acid export membrane protein